MLFVVVIVSRQITGSLRAKAAEKAGAAPGSSGRLRLVSCVWVALAFGGLVVALVSF
jgi:uncharacterized membrane protein